MTTTLIPLYFISYFIFGVCCIVSWQMGNGTPAPRQMENPALRYSYSTRGNVLAMTMRCG